MNLLWKAMALCSSLCMCLNVSTLKQLSSEAKWFLCCYFFFNWHSMHTLPKRWHSGLGYAGSGGSPGPLNGNSKSSPHRRFNLCSKGVCQSVAVGLAEQHPDHPSASNSDCTKWDFKLWKRSSKVLEATDTNMKSYTRQKALITVSETMKSSNTYMFL